MTVVTEPVSRSVIPVEVVLSTDDVAGATVEVVRPVVRSRAGSRGVEEDSLFETTVVVEPLSRGAGSVEVVLRISDIDGAVVEEVRIIVDAVGATAEGVRPVTISSAGSRGSEEVLFEATVVVEPVSRGVY